MKKLIGYLIGNLAVVATLTSSQMAFGWGQVGHQVVAQIADWHLCPATRMVVQSILKGDTMEADSTWADMVRQTAAYAHTKPWHFANISLGSDYANSQKMAGGDVVMALHQQVEVLHGPPGQAQTDALKFIIHFVGDSHQPFHAVLEARGANDIIVKYYGKTSNLHAVWDSGIIGQLNMSMVDIAKLANDGSQVGPVMIDERVPEDWVDESVILAAPAWPANARAGGAPIVLGQSYQSKFAPIVLQRLRTAGYRLAGLLNQELGGGCATP